MALQLHTRNFNSAGNAVQGGQFEGFGRSNVDVYDLSEGFSDNLLRGLPDGYLPEGLTDASHKALVDFEGSAVQSEFSGPILQSNPAIAFLDFEGLAPTEETESIHEFAQTGIIFQPETTPPILQSNPTHPRYPRRIVGFEAAECAFSSVLVNVLSF